MAFQSNAPMPLVMRGVPTVVNYAILRGIGCKDPTWRRRQGAPPSPALPPPTPPIPGGNLAFLFSILRKTLDFESMANKLIVVRSLWKKCGQKVKVKNIKSPASPPDRRRGPPHPLATRKLEAPPPCHRPAPATGWI